MIDPLEATLPRRHSPSGARAWLLAARPRTLAAGVAPVLLGTALAAAEHRAKPLLAGAAIATVLLLQLGTNFANDLFDFERGADTPERLGPTRAVAAGLITPTAMRIGAALAFLAAALTGGVLVEAGGWPFAILGVLSLGAGILYTAGPWPLAYHGLGDLAVFVFFGVLAVAGSYAVQTQGLAVRVVIVALPPACLVTAILAVNNLRDLKTDQRVGKRTLAVTLGDRGARAYLAMLVVAAYAGVVALVLAGLLGAAGLLSLLTLPAAFRILRCVRRSAGTELNDVLARTARVHAGFTSLLALGVLA